MSKIVPIRPGIPLSDGVATAAAITTTKQAECKAKHRTYPAHAWVLWGSDTRFAYCAHCKTHLFERDGVQVVLTWELLEG